MSKVNANVIIVFAGGSEQHPVSQRGPPQVAATPAVSKTAGLLCRVSRLPRARLVPICTLQKQTLVHVYDFSGLFEEKVANPTRVHSAG